MKKHKKYMDIVRYGKPSTQDVVCKGDIISISEKLDGANASFTLDEKNFLGVTCYSRRQILTPENTLQGFYGWVRESIVPIKDSLNPNYRYIGEWLEPHKIKYKEEHKKTFKLFSIWDEKNECYLDDCIVKNEAFRLGLDMVEIFYYGEYVSFEHMMSFVGKSNITETPNTGEGVVVKNSKYKNRSGDQVFVKLVSEAFAEVQKQKLPKNPNLFSEEVGIVQTVLTKPRVDKLLHKLVDEDLLAREEFTLSNMIKLIKLIAPRVIEDMYKEESEILSQLEEGIVKKTVGKILPKVIKEVIKEYEI